MKKTLAVIIIFTMLIFIAIARVQSIVPATASDDTLVEPPVITVFSPENKTYATNNITLSLNLSTGRIIDQRIHFAEINDVWFKGDWQEDGTYVTDDGTCVIEYGTFIVDDAFDVSTIEFFSCNLTGIPEGSHSIMVRAYEYFPDPAFPPVLWLERTSSVSVNFTIDVTPPSIAILSPEAEIYSTSELELNFTSNQFPSLIAYSLDGQENVTIAGNTTLTGLLDGEHNVTVYAWDDAGNVGASETVTFSITEPLPTAPIVAFAAVTAIIIISLAVYYLTKTKRKKPENPRITSNTS